MTDPGRRLLQLKVLLRDVHLAVWRRVRLADELSVADVRIHLIRLCFTLCDDGEAELAISD